MPNNYTGPFDGLRPNSQPIAKKTKPHASDALSVHSIFWTIQGEGPFSGTPAVFVRLAGCNLQCPMCDTEYTEGAYTARVDQILDSIQSHTPIDWRGLVVVTGGEPFRQNLTDLFDTLVDNGYYVQVETNGTLPPPKLYDGYSWKFENRYGVYIVCSPKTGKVHDDIRYRAACFKYVVSADAVDPKDGLPTSVLGLRNAAAKPTKSRDGEPVQPVYIQPADHQDEEINAANMQAALRSSLQYGYILQLQIHKYLGVE